MGWKTTEAGKAWRERNREHIREYNRTLYLKDPEKVLRRGNLWRNKNKETFNEKKRIRYATDLEYRERTKATGRRYSKDHPEGQRTRWLKHAHGLSQEQYLALVSAQDGKCAICRQAKSLAIDHDHSTNEFRGLLCGSCNRAIGLLQESPEIIRAAADYVERVENLKWQKTSQL